MTEKECKALLQSFEKLSAQRAYLAEINASPKDSIPVEAVLRDHRGQAYRVSMNMPKGFAQQEFINRIRKTEAEIRKYGVEPT